MPAEPSIHSYTRMSMGKAVKMSCNLNMATFLNSRLRFQQKVYISLVWRSQQPDTTSVSHCTYIPAFLCTCVPYTLGTEQPPGLLESGCVAAFSHGRHQKTSIQGSQQTWTRNVSHSARRRTFLRNELRSEKSVACYSKSVASPCSSGYGFTVRKVAAECFRNASGLMITFYFRSTKKAICQ